MVKVFLVDHSPFQNDMRSKLQTIIVTFYDKFIGPLTLKKFDAILSISKWGIPYLFRCGAPKDKIIYLPNGIPSLFFTKEKTAEEENKILFLGRISPKKKVETLIEAMSWIKSRNVILEIVGPKEPEYYEKLKLMVEELKLQNAVKFLDPIYELEEKINKIDSCKLFVLPSKVEGQPQSILEAMSRSKLVIGSNSEAIKDIIDDGINGYLFKFDNPQDLAEQIDLALEADNQQIKDNARKSVEEFNIETTTYKLIKLMEEKEEAIPIELPQH